MTEQWIVRGSQISVLFLIDIAYSIPLIGGLRGRGELDILGLWAPLTGLQLVSLPRGVASVMLESCHSGHHTVRVADANVFSYHFIESWLSFPDSTCM